MNFRRNITLSYVIAGLDGLLFWIPIWILFYLRITNYEGVGLLEAAVMATSFLSEIPTGAIGDMLGKRKTMILSMLVAAMGATIVGFSNTMTFLVLGIIIWSLGSALQSGTFQALVYDSLLSDNSEGDYERVNGHIETIRNVVIAVASLLGGLMYSYFAGLPYIGMAIGKVLAAIICFWLIEPEVDSEIFSLKNYLEQMKIGFQELFVSEKGRIENIMVVSLTALTVILGMILIDAKIISLGWDERLLGVIYASMFIVTAVIVQASNWVKLKWGRIYGILVVIFLMAMGMLVSTKISVLLATGLSGYNMLASMPYLFMALFVGRFIDLWSIDVVIWMWSALLTGLVMFWGWLSYSK
jgi:MFS family permease